MPRREQPKDADLLTSKEVAKLLRMNQTTIDKFIKEGIIEAIQLPGGQYRIKRSEVERILRSQK